MSKSIKLQDNTYWDSGSIMHDRKTLKDILNQQGIDKRIKSVSFLGNGTYTFKFKGYSGTMLILLQTNYTTKARTIANIVTCLANNYYSSSLESGFEQLNITHSFDSNTNVHTFSISADIWSSGMIIASGELT